MTDITPTPSATLILLRDGDLGLETFLLTRSAQLDFGANALVFPGGKLEEGDHEFLPDDPLGAHKTAALRETFEETGLFLARDSTGGTAIPAARQAALSHHRKTLSSGVCSFADICSKENITPDFSMLSLMARWMTPEKSPRQFDTYFFIAHLRDEARLEHDGGETVDSLWTRPSDVLELHGEGRAVLMPPTYWTLHDLVGYRQADEAIQALAAESVPLTRPQITIEDGSRVAYIPGRGKVVVGGLKSS